MEELEALRKEIDEVDTSLVQGIAKRLAIAQKIGIVKKTYQMEVLDEKREEDKLHAIGSIGEAYGLSAEFLKKLWEILLEESRKIQEGKHLA